MDKQGKKLNFSIVKKIPISLWVLFGFFIPYLLFFIWPIFLVPPIMEFPRYIPALDPIGVDLRQMLIYSDSWFYQNHTPYISDNLYPPLATVAFTPLLAFDYFSAYKVITIINIVLFVIISLILPLSIHKNKSFSALLILLFTTGLLSYGFQFELERGQFNVIAVSLTLIASWIYHKFGKLKILAYALFTISVQFKVYPFIFILMFIKDWRDWKKNIVRFVSLGFINALLLFVLGPNVFTDFITAIKAQTLKPSVWIGNHSIHSFVSCYISKIGLPNLNCANQEFQITEFIFLAMTVTCVLLIFLKALRNSDTHFNPVLLLACTLGALMIPPVSHDYTLSFLVAPVTILFIDIQKYSVDINKQQSLFKILLITLFSSAYASTLFSYAYKPDSFGLLYQNNFPALFIMLILITVLYMLARPHFEDPQENAMEVSYDFG